MGLSLRNIGKRIGDIAGGVERQINPFDNNATYKQQTPLGNQSTAQQVEGFARGFAHPFSTFGSAVIHTPQAIFREAQNKPIGDIQQNIFGTQNQGDIAKQILGDTATIGLTVAAPGIARGVGDVADAFLPNVASRAVLPTLRAADLVGGDVGTNLAARAAATPIATNLATRLTAGALANEGINTAFNTAGQVASGQPINVAQAAKSGLGPTAFGVGAEALPHVKSAIQQGSLGQEGSISLPKVFSKLNPSDRAATEASGLKPEQVVSTGEAKLLADWANYKINHNIPKNFNSLAANVREVADRAGIPRDEIINAPPVSVRDTIKSYIGNRQRFIDTKSTVSQGGYVRLPGKQLLEDQRGSAQVPGGGKQNLPDSLPNDTTSLPEAKSPKTTSPSVRGGVKAAGKGTNKLDTITGMHDILNRGGTVDEALTHYMGSQKSTLGEAQLALQKVLGSKSLDKSAINAKLNPEHGKLVLGAVSKGDHTQPILNSHAVATKVIERGNTALDAIKVLSPHDHALLDNLRTSTIDDLVKQAENPTIFRKAAEASKQYNDFTQAAGAHLGQDVAYRKNYGAPLLFEQTPEEVAIARKAFLKDHPGYGKTRTFRNYDEAAQYGLRRANQNFGQDIAMDVSRRANDLRQLTLAKGLSEAYPGQVKIGEIGNSPEGTYKQLQIPGGNKISLPADIADEVNRRAPAVKSKGALKAYDALNANLKYYKLGGGTFHGLTTAGTVAGQQLASGSAIIHPIQNLKIIAGTLSKTVHESNMKGFADRGVLDNARLSGVTFTGKQTVGDVQVGLAKKIPIIKQIHDAVFDRQIPEAKLTIFEQQTKGLDPTVPADLAKMRATGRAVNNLGGINRAVDGLTPQTAQKVSRAVLATDFTEGKFRTLDKALRDWTTPEGKIAKQMVVGKTLVFLLPTLAAATAAGEINWNDPKSVRDKIGGLILDPSFHTPFKTPAGYAKMAKTPETFVSELGRIIKPMFDGSDNKLAGAEHYATARLAALPSLGVQLRTNQDYQGNQIVAHDTTGKVQLKKTALNLGAGSLPIPASQGIKVAQGKQSGVEALVNTLGLRTSVDQTNPAYQKTKAYFKSKDDFTKSLNPNEQALFNKLNPTKKDQYGNDVKPNKTPLTNPSNYADFLSNPSFTAKYQSYQKSQSSHDPLWDLSSNNLRDYMNAQVISKYNPGGDSTTTNALYKRLPSDFFTKREQYFAGLKAQGVKLGDSGYSPRPSMPNNLVKFSENYHNLPYGTGQRSAALRSPEGQAYIAYLDKNRIYNNQERADLGLPPLEDPSNKYSRGGRSRTVNPYNFAVSLSAGGKPTVGKSKGSKVSSKPRGRSSVVMGKPKVTLKRATA